MTGSAPPPSRPSLVVFEHLARRVEQADRLGWRLRIGNCHDRGQRPLHIALLAVAGATGVGRSDGSTGSVGVAGVGMRCGGVRPYIRCRATSAAATAPSALTAAPRAMLS